LVQLIVTNKLLFCNCYNASIYNFIFEERSLLERALKDYHIIWFSLSPLTIVSINIQCLIAK